MNGELENKTALVTGAGRGIGREIAIQLARRGVRVALAARNEEQLEATAAAIRAEGGTALALAIDVADPDARTALVRLTMAELGTIDILINNAATVAPLGHFTSLTADGWHSALETNLVAPAVLSASIIPTMSERGWGRIVNISSGVVANPTGMVGGNIYASTKAALEAHTLNLAAELDGTGVTANAYRPGMVDTAMQEWIRDQDPAQIGQQLHHRFTSAHAGGKLITPAESASALLWHLDEHGADTGSIWDHTRV
jgi:NAD(P)-dependent dehydrogenase (short-subunit alcohol dehydrogenase family)